VILQAARDPRLVAGRFQGRDIVVADPPRLELAEDREPQTVVVVPRLCKVVGLLENGRGGPEVGRSGRRPSEAAVVIAKLQQPDDLVAASRIGAGQRIVDEGRGTQAYVGVLVDPRTGRARKRGRRGAALAEGLVVEVAHHAED